MSSNRTRTNFFRSLFRTIFHSGKSAPKASKRSTATVETFSRARRGRTSMIEILETRALLATVTWDGGAGTFNWFDANNWDTNAVPTTADDAVIPDLVGTPTITVNATTTVNSITSLERIAFSAGTITINSAGTFSGGLDLSSGTLSSNGTLVTPIGTTSSWSGGTLGRSGTATVVDNAGDWSFGGASSRNLQNGTFNNSGTFTQVAGQLAVNTSTFNNLNGGTYSVSGSPSSPFLTTLSGSVSNAGLLTCSTTATSISGTFSNTGIVRTTAPGANLTIPGGNSHTGNFDASSGTITFGTGATNFNTGTTFSAGAIGAFSFNTGGANYNFNDDTSITHVGFSAGNIVVAAGKTLTVAGTGNSLSAAVIAGSGQVRNTGTITLTGATAPSISGTFSNAGTFNHSAAISIGVTGHVINEVGGQYLITANTGGLNVSGGSTSGIQNLGTIQRTSGTGTFTFNASVVGTPTIENDGVVDLQTGSATWQGASDATHNGSFLLGNTTTLTFSSGTQSFGTSSTISGLGTAIFNAATAFNITDNVTFSSRVTISGGTVVAASGKTLELSDVVDFQSGAINGAGTVLLSGTGSVAGASVPALGVSNFVLSGTMNHSGTASWGVTGNFLINSTGQYLITAASGGLNVSGGGTSSIRNQGLIRRSSGAGNFNFVASIVGTPTVENDGTVELQSGTATWQGATDSTHNGTFDLSAGTTLTFTNGAQSFGTGASIVGAGTAAFTSGTDNFTGIGTYTAAMTVSGATLNFSESNTLQGALTVSSGIVSVSATKTVTLAATTHAWNSGGTFSGAGTLLVAATGTLTINPNGAGLGLQTVLSNQGTINVTTAGAINMSGAGTITNSGLIDLKNAAATLTNAGIITNTSSGTLRKSTATGTVTLGRVDNSGTIDVQTGTLNMNQGGVWTGGTYTVSSGALLQTALTGGSWTWSGTMTGSGAGQMKHVGGNVAIGGSGATWDFAPGFFTYNATTTISGQPVTVPSTKGVTFDPNGGTTTVSATLNVAGSITTTNTGVLSSTGTLNNTGVITVGSGTTLNASGTVTQSTTSTLTGGTWITSGTISFPAGAPNITTLGPSASVTYSGATSSFPKFATVQDIQGTFNIINRTFTGSAAGTIVNSGTFTIDGGTFAQTTARPLTQTSGAITLANSASIASSISSVTINGGTLSGTGTISSASVVNSGTIQPGSSPGILNITGNYTQGAAGVLNIEVGGTSAVTPDFDQILISGTATLGGTLNVSLINGFVPNKSDNFRFMTFASRSADFTTINLPQYNSRSLLNASAGATAYDLVGNSLLVKNLNDTGAFSVRDQIAAANAASDLDYLVFLVAGTLTPASQLPTISNPIVIDGTSAPGYAGTPVVVIDGVNAGALADGLELSGDGSTVRGLNIQRFGGNGIEVVFGNNNTFTSNWIGVNAAGLAAAPNAQSGILINQGANNIIGGSTAAARNVISGNLVHGVFIAGNLSSGNKVQGNYLGTDVSGTLAIGNGQAGVRIASSADGNVVGTDGDLVNDAGEGNLISGNGYGVEIVGSGTTTNVVAGNLIGTDANGTAGLGNVFGVRIDSGPSANIIGGTSSVSRNIISGNTIGINLTGTGTDGNFVKGNYIGLALDGATAIANNRGVLIDGSASGNYIGTNGDGVNDGSEGNVISGNTGSFGYGIQISDADNNIVAGNLIGLNAAGTTAVANTEGVFVHFGSTGNRIGTDSNGTSDSSERNIISGNTARGVRIEGTGTTTTLVAGNFIGTNQSGTSAIANGTGILIASGATSTLVGGTTSAALNLISGNNTGIDIMGSTTANNQVAGNLIGLNAAGDNRINAAAGIAGIRLSGGTHDNIIGGLDAASGSASRNYIAPYSRGIWINGASDNFVASNYIGQDVA
ncbi:MAG: hypothetical protein U0996_24325, partial [Planctomycetaceae bacterium]